MFKRGYFAECLRLFCGVLAAIRRVLADILRRIKGVLPATKARSLSNVVKQINTLLEAASAAQEQATTKTATNKVGNYQYSLADMADIAAERKAIEKTAKANGTYLKAPNGKKTNLSSKQWVDVRTKRFKAWFGDWELAANIRSGINALLQISQGADSVPNAMQRSELSKLGGTAEITFDWGKYGKRDKSGTLRGGFGFAKIIQKHGYNEAFRIIETIARGKLGTPYGVEGGTRIDIVNGEYHTTISLYRDGQRESWVLTGYKIDPNTDAKGRGNDLSDATQTYPTPTREDLGAALKSTANIQYFNEISNISSKIVDANGEPKVVYHQTNATEYVNVETGELGP